MKPRPEEQYRINRAREEIEKSLGIKMPKGFCGCISNLGKPMFVSRKNLSSLDFDVAREYARRINEEDCDFVTGHREQYCSGRHE